MKFLLKFKTQIPIAICSLIFIGLSMNIKGKLLFSDGSEIKISLIRSDACFFGVSDENFYEPDFMFFKHTTDCCTLQPINYRICNILDKILTFQKS